MFPLQNKPTSFPGLLPFLPDVKVRRPRNEVGNKQLQLINTRSTVDREI